MLRSFSLICQEKSIKLVKVSEAPDSCCVQLSIIVQLDLTVSILAHNRQIPATSDIWSKFPRIKNTKDLLYVIKVLNKYTVCSGNHEGHFQDLMPLGVPTFSPKGTAYSGYKEADFGEVAGTKRIKSSIRSMECSLLVAGSEGRCPHCKMTRITLNTMLRRKKMKTEDKGVNYVSSRKRLDHMSQQELRMKVRSLQQERKRLLSQTTTLQSKNKKLKEEITRSIRSSGYHLSNKDTDDMNKLMEELVNDENNSPYQKLLIEQQLKYNRLRNPKSMRWHPMIIKWCLYVKSKSPKAYKTLKESQFMNLPSERTLYDYSHYIKGYKYSVKCLIVTVIVCLFYCTPAKQDM